MKILALLLVCFGSASCADLSTVSYLLWTRANPGDGEVFRWAWTGTDTDVLYPGFDGSKRTYFAYHGWQQNPVSNYILDAKNALLDIEDINFISVDYTILGGKVDIKISIQNMYEVANHTARFIDFLVSETELTTSNIHIWGHSLGGQACGMTGHYVQSGVIDRITALDPATVLFKDVPSDRRTDPTSAAFVDVINTARQIDADTGVLEAMDSRGHAEFYPNGGYNQPGCSQDAVSFDKVDPGCSHARSNIYFVESIKSSTAFKSYPCESWESYEDGECDDCGDNCNVMGYHADPGKHGDFFLRTNSEAPYSNEE